MVLINTVYLLKLMLWIPPSLNSKNIPEKTRKNGLDICFVVSFSASVIMVCCVDYCRCFSKLWALLCGGVRYDDDLAWEFVRMWWCPNLIAWKDHTRGQVLKTQLSWLSFLCRRWDLNQEEEEDQNWLDGIFVKLVLEQFSGAALQTK